MYNDYKIIVCKTCECHLFHIRLEYKVKKKYLSRSCRIPGGQALFLLWKLEEAGVQLTYWVVRPLATFSAVGCCKA